MFEAISEIYFLVSKVLFLNFYIKCVFEIYHFENTTRVYDNVVR